MLGRSAWRSRQPVASRKRQLAQRLVLQETAELLKDADDFVY
jgi:hypothetical protein